MAARLSSEGLQFRHWVIATSLGWLLGFVFVLVLAAIFEGVGLGEFQFFLGVGMSGGVAAAQLRLLMRYNIKFKWIGYSLLGMGASFLLVDVLNQFGLTLPDGYYLPLGATGGIVAVSFLQHKLLQKTFGRSGNWLQVSILGWVLAVLMVVSIDYIKLVVADRWILFFINLIMILGGGVVLGLVTARRMTDLING